MGAVRFEGVDILDSLGQIMELHTQHYKDDFDLDKELIPKLALSGEPEPSLAVTALRHLYPAGMGGLSGGQPRK